MANEDRKIEAKDYSRISNLPNDILSFIISLLSTKEAYRTRLLSREWRYLSPRITNLCFDSLTMFGERTNHESMRFDYDYNYPKQLMDQRNEFVAKINQCLQDLRVPRLHSLEVSFCLSKEYASCIDEWIRLAIAMAVEKIDLDVFCNPKLGVELYSFPCHLLPPADQASHLEHLRLGSCILSPGPDLTNRLSSLKTLTLTTVPLDQTDLDTIFSACFKIECLTLWNCILPKIFRISGQLRHLKSLAMDCYLNNSLLENIEIHEAISLNQFEYKGRSVEFSFRDLPCLKRLHIWWWRILRKEFVFDELPKAIPHLQNLSMCFHATMDGTIPENITKFNCVTHLELFVFVSSGFNLLSLTYIINAAPLLQKLHISLARGYSGGPRQPRTYNRHVHLQLKEAEINAFHNRENEIELAVYLLHNCIALERMTINRQARFYHSNGQWVNHDNYIIKSGPSQKDVHDILAKEIVDSNLGVELIVL